MFFCIVYFDFKGIVGNVRVIKMDIYKMVVKFFWGEMNGEVFIIEVRYLSFFFIF